MNVIPGIDGQVAQSRPTGWSAAGFSLLSCVVFCFGFAAVRFLAGSQSSILAYSIFNVLLPTAVGAVLASFVLYRLDWRKALLENLRLQRHWLPLCSVVSFAVSMAAYVADGNWDRLGVGNIVVGLLCAVLIAAALQILFNGYLVVGLRQVLPEPLVWFLSTCAFSAPFALAVLVKNSASTNLGWSVGTFAIFFFIGSNLYLMRRLSWNLLAPTLLLSLVLFWMLYLSGHQGTHSDFSLVGGIALLAMVVFTPCTLAAIFLPRSSR